MLILEYSLSKKPSKKAIRACDKGAKSMQDLLVTSAKLIVPKLHWLMWLMTRVYFRKITNKSITYKFPFILGKDKIEKGKIV